jgi:hypothetical protein
LSGKNLDLLHALLVDEGDEHRVDLRLEDGASDWRRDRDAPALRRHPPGAWKSGGAG